MNSFFALLWFAANVVMIIFIIKAVKEKDSDQKKQKRKIWLISLAVAVVSLVAFAATDNSSSDSNEEINAGKQVEETTVEETANDDSDSNSSTEEAVSVDESNAIELVAGELGDYGKEITMSEGTDLEEHLVVYYLPAGKYDVKNIGEYRTQVSVYEGYTKNADGYDEYTDSGDVVLLNVDETAEIEVPDGWFVEIHEPTHITLIAK